jgi:hypothetical protein
MVFMQNFILLYHAHLFRRIRPPQVDQRYAEKSVQIMSASSGGALRGAAVVNRWGKVENPPAEWLYHGGEGGGGPSGRIGGLTLSSGVSGTRAAMADRTAGSSSTGSRAVQASAGKAYAGQGHSSEGSGGRSATDEGATSAPAGRDSDLKLLPSGFKPVYD